MGDRLKALENDLTAAQRRLKDARGQLSSKAGDAEQQTWRAARQQVLDLERQIAAEKGEPHAVPMDFPLKWDIGAPLPFVFATDDKTILTFRIDRSDPDWDGTNPRMVEPAHDDATHFAVVEFGGCLSSRFGAPNDEVLGGHDLHGRGLEPYTAQIVVDSPWTTELKGINKVHPYYREDSWHGLSHYVFWFHDSTFECVASSYVVENHRETWHELLARVSRRLLE